MGINGLWHRGTEQDWKDAIAAYYENPFVKKNIDLERRIEAISPDAIRKMDGAAFYCFLYDEYFKWKYTAPNRLATTRKSLSRYESEGVDQLEEIRRGILQTFDNDPYNTKEMLSVAKQIYGLGTAGASGLLAIIFPELYGTVDQFLVYSLLKVRDFPEHSDIERMNPLGLTVKNGIVLENIMRRKAQELNEKFKSDKWTPRKVDMVLWVVRE